VRFKKLTIASPAKRPPSLTRRVGIISNLCWFDLTERAMQPVLLDARENDARNPNPWLALYLDVNSYLDDSVKAALLKSNASFSRRFFFPIAMPLSRLAIALVKLFKIISPRWPNSSRLLHLSIYHGLKWFVSPEANYLILRHFNIGSENLKFIERNVPGIEIKSTRPLKPKTLEDLIDDTFLIHDLNIFNFVIEFNDQLKAQDREIERSETLRFDCISDDGFGIDIRSLPNRWLNFIDLHTAIEMYTPLYAFFLTDSDFWRASNSLQLDQTIALYLSRVLDRPDMAALVNNRHPLLPLFVLSTSYRLMLHGHDAEAMHGLLRRLKRQQAAMVETVLQP